MTREDAIQAACARFLTATVRRPVIWFHTPNGGHRDVRVAQKLRAHGVRKGVADLLVFWDGGRAAIELKTELGTLEPEQYDFAEDWIRCGGGYALARSVEDVETALRFWGVPLTGTAWRTGSPIIVDDPAGLPLPGRIVFRRERARA